MLVKALARPLVNNLCKVPSRSTSAIVGARTNNVSVAVSIKVSKKSIGLFSYCYCVRVSFANFRDNRNILILFILFNRFI